MFIRVRQTALEDTVIASLRCESLQLLLPMELLQQVLVRNGCYHRRCRKLAMEWVVLIVVFMSLYRDTPISGILGKLLHPCALLTDQLPSQNPTAGAIFFRREQLGVEAMRQLTREVCRPLATQETKGAFLYGLRVMAIDGHVIAVRDAPENASYFGYHQSGRGKSVFPLVQAVYLCEVGTRAIIDGGFWPSNTSEQVGAHRMLRSIKPGMLVMWDKGLHDYYLIREVLRRGSHVLARLPCNVKVETIRVLSDGSKLGWLYPSGPQRSHLVNKGLIVKGSARDEERIQVRLIEYVITDKDLPGYGEVHRIITTLLDEEQCPGPELAVAYHERWEIETTLDEIETHQLLGRATVRSEKPLGVLQELYGVWLGHYLLRKLIHQAAVQAAVDPDRISFTHALRLVNDTMPLITMGAVLTGKLSEWTAMTYEWLIKAIASKILPARAYRSNPRCVKQTNRTKFRAKKTEDYSPPKLVGTFRQAVKLI